MLVFNDSIEESYDSTKRFWIKNTISTVKLKKQKSNDTNLIEKILTNQDIYEKNRTKKNSNSRAKKNSNSKDKRNTNSKDKKKSYRKNLNYNSYNSNCIKYINGKKQTKKAKKIKRSNY